MTFIIWILFIAVLVVIYQLHQIKKLLVQNQPKEETLSEDEMYQEAEKVVKETGKASASLLQRKLKIGYARAARLLDILEEKGIIGPAEGASPRVILEKEEKTMVSNPPISTKKPSNTKRKILLVDDDEFLQEMYSVKFTDHGFITASVFTGVEALEKIDNGFEPDIILTNIIMPGMDGFQMIGELKERGLDQKAVIIILSSLGQKEDIERALALGVDGYIVKATATPSEVVDKVSEIYDNSRNKKLTKK